MWYAQAGRVKQGACGSCCGKSSNVLRSLKSISELLTCADFSCRSLSHFLRWVCLCRWGTRKWQRCATAEDKLLKTVRYSARALKKADNNNKNNNKSQGPSILDGSNLKPADRCFSLGDEAAASSTRMVTTVQQTNPAAVVARTTEPHPSTVLLSMTSRPP